MPPNSSTSSSEEARQERGFRRYAAVFAAIGVALFAAGAWLPVMAAQLDARRNFGDEASVIVWGDSRTQSAFDLARIGSAIERPLWSFSRAGSGPYDLMVTEELVPDGATVIISPSLAMLVRPTELDSNRIGLSWRALARLWRSGVPISSLHEIWVNNRYSLGARHARAHPAKATADAILEEHLDAYRERLRNLDSAVLDQKLALLWASIDHLIARGCDVYLVEVPVSESFGVERRASKAGDFSERLARAAAARGVPALLGVELSNDLNSMWDHTHVNERGRAQFTGILLDRWGESWRRSPDSE